MMVIRLTQLPNLTLLTMKKLTSTLLSIFPFNLSPPIEISLTNPFPNQRDHGPIGTSLSQIQTLRLLQWYLGIKATPMGANLVLLENVVEGEGEMETIINEASLWLKEWFSDLRKWCTSEVDDEYLTWIKVYGVPVHAWEEDFFKCVVFGSGEYVTMNESTATKKALDVARILIRRKRYDVVNLVVRFMINGEIFIIKIVEDWFAPQWYSWSKPVDDSSSNSSESGDEEEDDFHGDDVSGYNVTDCDLNLDNVEDDDTVKDAEEEPAEEVAVVAVENTAPVDGRMEASAFRASVSPNGAVFPDLGVEKIVALKVPISKETNDESNVTEFGKSHVVTSIILNTTVNGKNEKVKFVGCDNVDINISNGEISYNPYPNSIISCPAHFFPDQPSSPQNIAQSISPQNTAQPSPLPLSSPPPISNPPPPGTVPPPFTEAISPLPSHSSTPPLTLVVDLTRHSIHPINLLETQPLDSPFSYIATSSLSLSMDGDRFSWANNSLSKEEKVWSLAKEVGVSGVVSDEEHNLISDLERRDKEKFRSLETSTGFK